MTRASFLITLLLSAAAAAQQPALPLPGAEPALPLPAQKKQEAKKEKKDAAPAALPLPAIDLSKPGAVTKVPPPPLPLPGLDAPKPADNKAPPALTLPGTQPAATAQKPPAPAADKPQPAVADKSAAPATDKPKPAVADKSAAPATDKPKPAVADKSAAPASDKSKLPAVAPLASSAIRLGDLRLRPAYDQDLWNLRGFVGAERSSEQNYTDATSHNRLGVEATRWFSGTWIARGEIDWRSSTQGYVPLHSTTNSQVKVDENRFDVIATVGYDVGPNLVQSGRLELTPMLGLAYVGIRNQAFPSDLIGPDLGGRVRWALSPAVIAHATLGYTFNLAVASVQNSALKSPKGDFNTRAGLSLPLSGGYALELDYQGDVLAFENTFRVAHGAALGFGTTF